MMGNIPSQQTGTGTRCVCEHLPSNRRQFGVALYFCACGGRSLWSAYQDTILDFEGMHGYGERHGYRVVNDVAYFLGLLDIE